MQPTNVEAFRKYVPAFQADIIYGVGHLVFWENPEEFNTLLEKHVQGFLAE
jgi:pimeloyl-ACP methyl ester carboxylesterase